MSNKPKFSNTPADLSDRLFRLRAKMVERGASFCLVRATDGYLNEYVPLEQSRRAFISGFTGSMGDALIGLDSAFLFVDGRYALQGKKQAPFFDVSVLPLGVSIESAWLSTVESQAKGCTVLVEEDRIAVDLYESMKKTCSRNNISLEPDLGIIQEMMAAEAEGSEQKNPVWKVDERITGTSRKNRIDAVNSVLSKNGLNGFLLVALDDIAWLSGYRGSDFAYQSTFAAKALLLENDLWLMASHSEFRNVEGIRHFDGIKSGLLALGNAKNLKIGFDPRSTPVSLYHELEKIGVSLEAIPNPIQDLKARKCEAEIAHMYASFAKADEVVFKTQKWVCEQVEGGNKITEADVDRFVRERFVESGTVGLSFPPICGYAKNGAVIHHSIPDPTILLKEGELFLLDTGGIYEGGYATDLTRTFLVGGPKTQAKQAHKEMFTLVLKGSIAGMSARLPSGITGIQLDALVRAPFWQLGLNFAHGTGHGIGINVHEFPPRIATFGAAKLEVGHVFSIEPGLYIPDFGGVRIENLCTLVNDEKSEGYLRVLPLTFAPLDERLIDYKMLTSFEVSFLEYFEKRFENKEKTWNVLPPLDEAPAELMKVVRKN